MNEFSFQAAGFLPLLVLDKSAFSNVPKCLRLAQHVQTAAVFTAAASCFHRFSAGFLEKKRRRHHVALDEESERVLVAVTGNTGRTHAAVEGEADRHGDERFGFHRVFVLSPARVEQTAPQSLKTADR